MPENRKMLIEQLASGEFIISMNFEDGLKRHEMRAVEVLNSYRIGNYVECAFREADYVTTFMAGGNGETPMKLTTPRQPDGDDIPF